MVLVGWLVGRSVKTYVEVRAKFCRFFTATYKLMFFTCSVNCVLVKQLKLALNRKEPINMRKSSGTME